MRSWSLGRLLVTVCCALFTYLPDPAIADGLKPDIMLSAGPRSDEFDWNIAAPSGTPNILSELTWDNIDIFQIKGTAWTPVNRSFYIRGAFGYGWIYDGDNRDSDYNGDNRTLEFSRSNNSSDTGDVWDASAGVGYIFLNTSMRAASLLGYSYHMQNFTMTDGFQTIPPLGPFPGLNSSYDAMWYGPWFGLEVTSGYMKEALTFRGTFEYHLAHYKAQANWNLRTDFQHPVSFEHRGNGSGVVVSAGLDYAVDERWSVNGDLLVQRWKIEDGTDVTFLSNGSTPSTPLNEVNWSSSALMFGIKYRY